MRGKKPNKKTCWVITIAGIEKEVSRGREGNKKVQTMCEREPKAKRQGQS